MLTVELAEVDTLSTAFTFVVPGHQLWAIQSIRATALRGTGGMPNRSYLLTVTDGTNPVSVLGAVDIGDEPGECTITWTASQASAVNSGPVGVVVAPLGTLNLEPGYIITGTIVNPVAGDSWDSAACWYDFEYN